MSEEWAGSTFAPYFVSTMSSRYDWDMKELEIRGRVIYGRDKKYR